MYKFFVLVFVVVVLGAPPDLTFTLHNYNISDSINSNTLIGDVRYRLPNDTLPYHYVIDLITNIHKGDFSFLGKVEIKLRVLNKTSKIVIHQRQLNIENYELFNADGEQIKIQDSSYDTLYEFLTFETSMPMLEGNYVLKIDYNGMLRGKGGFDGVDAGFYRSSYINDKNNTIWLATTHFESTDARHAFPCYDEPGTKTVISLKITHHKSYTAISNTPVLEKIDIDSEFVQTVFEDSPKMSTYLLAFVVSDFVPKFNLNSKIKHGVYAIPHRVAELDVALDYGVKVLDILENYTGTAYPIAKMDQIGIPDFAAGAMENWGLVTYQVVRLYYDEKTSIYKQKEIILKIIAHEFAHQYFGDLVTPEWWTYIWLNEGFATLYSSYLAGMIDPKLKSMDAFVVEVLQFIFREDSLEQTRAMTTEAYAPLEISKLFDDIAYEKSGCVLRMMQHVLTDEGFRAGIYFYIIARKYQSANPNDLFINLQKAADELPIGLLPKNTTISEIMTTWTTQQGFPLLNVVRDESNPNIIHLSQERYLLELNDTKKITWYIPYNYVRRNEINNTEDWTTHPTGWLENVEKSDLKLFSELKNDEWILFNKHQTGYYRVNYDDKNWKLLIKELITEKLDRRIHYLNRAQLIDDAMMHARTGRLSYTIALSLLEYIKNERNYIAFYSFNVAMLHLEPAVFGTDIHQKLLSFLSEITEQPYKYYGIVEKPLTDEYHDYFARRLLIDWACKSGNQICLQDTAKALLNHLSNNEISEYLKDIIMSYGIRNSTIATHSLIWENIKSNHKDRASFIIALSNSQDGDFLRQLLRQTIIVSDELNLTGLEKISILSNALESGEIGFESVFNFLIQYDTQIIVIYRKEIESVLKAMANKITTEEWINRYTLLINKYAAIVGGNTQDYIKIAKERKHWYDGKSLSLLSFFEQHH